MHQMAAMLEINMAIAITAKTKGLFLESFFYTKKERLKAPLNQQVQK